MVNLIIPVYKARDTLPQALDSLVAQIKKTFIVTIVQDCDEEDYKDIIDEYRRRGLQIRFVCMPENLGPGCARQYGMDIDAMCDYFMFLDADDMLYPRAIDVLYHEAKLHNADIVSSGFVGENEHAATFFDVMDTPVTWMHGKIYRAQFLRDNNIRFKPDIRLNEDSYFNLVAINCTKNKYKIKEYTYLWRENKSSITRAEERINYLTKSWIQYIKSQIYGIEDIIKITGDIETSLLAMTLNNMYTQMMEAVYYKLPIEESKPKCLALGKNKLIREKINTEEFWRTLHSVLKPTLLKKDALIFLKMRFCDWLNEYILGEEVEIDIK